MPLLKESGAGGGGRGAGKREEALLYVPEGGPRLSDRAKRGKGISCSQPEKRSGRAWRPKKEGENGIPSKREKSLSGLGLKKKGRPIFLP